MNGICAGGTGSFIDQMASLLQTDAAGLNEYAKNYKAIYPIAARCGVFAKSDIQPLINDGATREDLAASIFQAVVNQTISGLACGKPIRAMWPFWEALFISSRSFGPPLCGPCASRRSRPLRRSTPSVRGRRRGHESSGEQEPVKLDDMIASLTSGIKMDFEVKRMEPLFRDQEEYDEFLARHADSSVKSAISPPMRDAVIWESTPVPPPPRWRLWARTAAFSTVSMTTTTEVPWLPPSVL